MKNLNTWLSTNITLLNTLGYRTVPLKKVGDDLIPLTGFANGESCDINSPLWLSSDQSLIGVVLDDTVLIDWDGYKDGACSLEELAIALDLPVQGLIQNQAQFSTSKESRHFLFKFNPDFDRSSIKQANNGKWMPHVDIKTGNQLIHIKENKELNIGRFIKDNLSFVPSMIIEDALHQPVFDNKVGEIKECVNPDKSLMAKLDVDCQNLRELDQDRNTELNNLALFYAKRAYGGLIDINHVETQLCTAYVESGKSSSSFTATWGSALRKAQQEPVNAPSRYVIANNVFGGGEIPKRESGLQGNPYMDISQQLEYFDGCTYVESENAILRKNGILSKPDQFRSMYGGHGFICGENANGTVKTTNNAWDAFTANVLYQFPKVEKLKFDPLSEFGEITHENGVSSVNSYRPMHGVRCEGDATPFLNHIAKLLPDVEDQNILLDWMAHKVQNPGECMKWSPVLVGLQGNGKTTVTDIMMYCIGSNYSSLPQSGDIDNKFNGWAYKSLLAVISDFKVGERRDIMEILKPIITDTQIPIQRKGREVEQVNNHLGVMITTNHMDGIVKSIDDRRYAVFYTGQMEHGI